MWGVCVPEAVGTQGECGVFVCVCLEESVGGGR